MRFEDDVEVTDMGDSAGIELSTLTVDFVGVVSALGSIVRSEVAFFFLGFVGVDGTRPLTLADVVFFFAVFFGFDAASRFCVLVASLFDDLRDVPSLFVLGGERLRSVARVDFVAVDFALFFFVVGFAMMIFLLYVDSVSEMQLLVFVIPYWG